MATKKKSGRGNDAVVAAEIGAGVLAAAGRRAPPAAVGQKEPQNTM